MSHIILTGCTGTAGAGQAEGKDKVQVLIHKDFNSYPHSLLSKLEGASSCVWALGISTSQVNASEYRVITYDYALAAAEAFASLSPAFNFVYISGAKVSRTPGRFTPLFARVKGEAEASLLALRSEHPGLRIWNVRPAFIDETQSPLREGPSVLTKWLADRVAPAFRALWPNGVTPTGPLAEVLVRCAEETAAKEDVVAQLGGKGVAIEQGATFGVVIENEGIRRLAGL